jgi:UDP-4-amino-4,6-dideoxy-N-acetyl-beta-L-altrosamine N-acetyltransferase
MITLRDVEPRDRETLRTWRNLPHVARNMYTDHEISADEHRAWFDGIHRNPSVKYWIVESGGTGIGVANLAEINRAERRCGWAFYLADEEGSRGAGAYVEYAVLAYVFETLAFDKLSCEVLAFNERVLSLHAKFGFHEEGRLRQHVLKGGVRVDVVCLGLLKDEWRTFAATPLAGRLAGGVRPIAS